MSGIFQDVARTLVIVETRNAPNHGPHDEPDGRERKRSTHRSAAVTHSMLRAADRDEDSEDGKVSQHRDGNHPLLRPLRYGRYPYRRDSLVLPQGNEPILSFSSICRPWTNRARRPSGQPGSLGIYGASMARRKPICPVELSGVDAVLAAGRYRLQ